MDGPLFEQLCRELIPATLWSAVKRSKDRTAVDEARVLVSRALGPDDLDELRNWASGYGDLDEQQDDFDDLATLRDSPTLEWSTARNIADLLDGAEYEKPRLTLLRMMREMTPLGEMLGYPAFIQEGDPSEALPLGAFAVSPNPQLDQLHDEYGWYWARYISTAVSLGRINDEELESPAGLDLMRMFSPRDELTYSLGMLQGAVTQRLQQGVTANEPIMNAIRELAEATSRRDKTTFAMQMALGDKLSQVQTTMTAMNDIFVEGLGDFEKTAWLAESRSLENARSQLVRDWQASHTAAQHVELTSRAEGLVGAVAWQRLDVDSRSDLLLYLSLSEGGEHQRVAALLLCICLERELGAALQAAGYDSRGTTYERKLQAAETSTEPRLRRLGAELKALSLHALRNPLAHGGRISGSELQKLEENLLTSHAGDHGLLGQLAVLRPTK